jgi:hypothetical protein
VEGVDATDTNRPHLPVERRVDLARGCVQAQRCHTNACPEGGTTQKQGVKRFWDEARPGTFRAARDPVIRS